MSARLTREQLEFAARTNLETVARMQAVPEPAHWHAIEDLLSVKVHVGYRIDARCFGRDVSIVLTRIDLENNGVLVKAVPFEFLTADQRALAADLVMDEEGIDRESVTNIAWEAI